MMENSLEIHDKPIIRMITLGCAKNEVDSEEMLGVLDSEGFVIDSSRKQADVVIINTCGFIESARQESVDTILQAIEEKKSGNVQKVIVTGCMAQKYSRELSKELPEVDAFLGAGSMSLIAETVRNSFLHSSPLLHIPEKPHHRWLNRSGRVRTGDPWTAYLKISEGCNHTCSFCTIPQMRGEHVSKPMESILHEASDMAEDGVKELNLIAQDSTQYGYDLYGKPKLSDLLKELAQINGAEWIRLFYCYPSRVTQEIIETIANTPRICQYIDMPLQHADNEMLRAMRRPGTAESYLRLLEQFRAASPDICIRTTFIVGFPGETDAHFENLLSFVEEAQFDRLGVFEYSLEKDTPSGQLPGRAPARIKHQRKNRLMQLQQKISLEKNRKWIGREIDALVERVNTDGTAIGRTYRDAPEIDGAIYISGARVKLGEFVRVRITGAREYDFMAEMVELEEAHAGSTNRLHLSQGG
jgi:ribosomal protein S12 methylthiotransferase